MQKWVNFLRGSARLEISGPFPERFLNLCSVEGLGFWKVEVCSQTALHLTVALWDLRRARRLAEKAGCTVRRVGGGGAAGLSLFLSPEICPAGRAGPQCPDGGSSLPIHFGSKGDRK